jgi:hypothetical protein
VRIAAANLGPCFGTDRFPARIETTGWASPKSYSPAYDVESLPALVVSPYPELRESTQAADVPIRAIAPVVFNGRIDPPGDDDRFVLATTPGQRLRIRVQASELGSALDGVLRLLGNNNAILANADDTTVPQPARNNQRAQPLVYPDPSLDFTVPGGTHEITLVIRDLENRGGVGFPYRIVVEPLIPDFELLPNDPQVSIPRNGAALVGVTIRRKGYSGPITVTVADPPAGLTVRPGTIPSGQNAGTLSLGAAADASFPVIALRLVGRGQGPDGSFERVACKPEVFARLANMPVCAFDQIGLVAAPALALPVEFETPAEPIEVPHGSVVPISIKIVRKKGAESAFAITPLPLPAGLTFSGATIAEKATEGKVTVKAALAAPLGMTTLGMRAKGKLGGADRTLDLAAVTLNVVPPAVLELSAPAIEIKQGATVELKGRIVRKGAFAGGVTVKINGLPAGLRAEPVTVAGDVGGFVLKIVANATAAATTAGSQVAMAFQVDKKDYSVPPVPLSIKVLPFK